MHEKRNTDEAGVTDSTHVCTFGWNHKVEHEKLKYTCFKKFSIISKLFEILIRTQILAHCLCDWSRLFCITIDSIIYRQWARKQVLINISKSFEIIENFSKYVYFIFSCPTLWFQPKVHTRVESVTPPSWEREWNVSEVTFFFLKRMSVHSIQTHTHHIHTFRKRRLQANIHISSQSNHKLFARVTPT